MADVEHLTDAVKLVDADDLPSWDRFPRYQEHDAITLGAYRAGAKRLGKQRLAMQGPLRAHAQLELLDRDEPVIYQQEFVRVPRSVTRKWVPIAVPAPRLPESSVRVDDGQANEGSFRARGSWRASEVSVEYSAPSRVVHAAEIDEHKHALEALDREQSVLLADILASPFARPVVFISHRWRGTDHPDPQGEHLRRLRALHGCYLIFDYSSFPQPPRDPPDDEVFAGILAAMDSLVDNVVVLADPDYLERGWCVYEYLATTLACSTVCDEVADPRFIKLRDWVNTPETSTPIGDRDSFEAMMTNYKNRRIIELVNEILPTFSDADFRSEHDSTNVTTLLTARLQRRLPHKREHAAYLGEWNYVKWTDDELRGAFLDGLTVPANDSQPMASFKTDVPTTLDVAADRRFAIKKMSERDARSPMRSLAVARRHSSD
ncbi:MAG TPA: hypothetical protein VFB78_08295 [Acidimicrobiales bacterium]|nr:hypothetical protein [Acidimicrobiales bacterium]